ncbi:glycosyltransferase family 4 protein [Verrucomicrobiales bacterium BCK34]|nr:glycosyltransferase family 4 protein [Verrucomicrobiales bacterium BCK34]
MNSPPKIVYITAGAGGMYCGSCIRDNALVAGLEKLGWDVMLLPLYTPIRVDEEDRSVDQVFFGGVNVYLQQKIPFFRWIPKFLDRWLDNPKLIRRVASGAVSVSAKELGAMTYSMVRGEDGFQKKEVQRLVHWLKEVVKPDLICLTNLLVGGSIPALKRELDIPVLVMLQGDDVFLDELEEPWRGQVLDAMSQLAAQADGFITFSGFYRDHISEVFGIPAEKYFITPLGLQTDGSEAVVASHQTVREGKTLGYFARLAPEKGFDLAVDAFLILAAADSSIRFEAGGWLSEKDEAFVDEQREKIQRAGLEDRSEIHVSPDGKAKMEMLNRVDVFTVPARFIEPKGLSVLEAMACGLPVVVPDRGAYPEMIAGSGGGLLCEPENAEDLAGKIGLLLADEARCRELGDQAREWVLRANSREAMARATGDVFAKVLGCSLPERGIEEG